MHEIIAGRQGKASKLGKKDKLDNGDCDGNQNGPIMTNGGLEEAVASEEKPRVPPIPLPDATCEIEKEKVSFDFGSRVKLIKINNQVRELQTILRDRKTQRSDFMFYADRLIRLVVEEGLNQLPYDNCTVTTPTGAQYDGLAFQRGNCGVSIMRSGEAMEKGLRDCCRSIRIGKILIQVHEETDKPVVYYAKFPPDIQNRKVLLMCPILNTGATVLTAINVLLEHGVKEENIVILTVFSTPDGIQSVLKPFPTLIILTSEIHTDCFIQFGRKYFGTDC